MAFQEIPIDAVANQRFEVVFKDIKYVLEITQNRLFDFYLLSIYLEGEPILLNRKLTFDRNAIEPFLELNIGSVLGLYRVDETAGSTFEDFGTKIKLLYEE